MCSVVIFRVKKIAKKFFDSEDDYYTVCRIISHCQQQTYLGIHPPGRSYSTSFDMTPGIKPFTEKVFYFFAWQKKHTTSEEESMNQLLTIQFNWKGDVKPIGSSFIGTSPEFEMALYTVCFLAGQGKDVHVELDDYDVIIKAHHIGRNLGTCYPNTVWK